jgi:hypothetical protein
MARRKDPRAKRLKNGAGSPSFEDLRGLLKEAFRSLGGGEAFLKAERKGFSRANATLGLTPRGGGLPRVPLPQFARGGGRIWDPAPPWTMIVSPFGLR